jgi:hypothetical protein
MRNQSSFFNLPYMELNNDRFFKHYVTCRALFLWITLSMFFGKPNTDGSSISGIFAKKEASSFWFLGMES